MCSVDNQDETMEFFENENKAETMESISSDVVEETIDNSQTDCENSPIIEMIDDNNEQTKNSEPIEDTQEVQEENTVETIQQEEAETDDIIQKTEETTPQQIINTYDDTALMSAVNKIQSNILLAVKKISDLKVHEKIEDSMHKEIQEYKKDFYATLIKPFLREFVSLVNSMQKDLKGYLADKEEEQNKDMIESLQYYIGRIQGTLSNNGVERYTSNEGDAFEVGTHQIIKTVPTEDEALNGTIAESKNDGYRYEGKVFVPERVIVYKFKPITEN